MSTSNSDGIVALCSHVFKFCDWQIGYIPINFTIEEIDNCNFEMGVLGSEKDDMLTLNVIKDNEKSVSAKITVSFLQTEITRFVDNWIKICQFTAETSRMIVKDVTVHCEIIWYGITEDSSSIQAPLNSFSNFKNLHLNSSLSDLKISISGEEFAAHKFILAAHSSVFFSMFETDMKEKRENRIVIEGIELDVMKVVLSILYTGYDKDLDEVEMAKNVLIVAERYDMTTLKRLCEWKLFQKLELSNVLDILEAADNCNAEPLHAACINFIIDNKNQMIKVENLKTFCHRKSEVMWRLFKKLMSIS